MVHELNLDANISIHLTQKVQIALSMAEKVTILKRYLDYANIFLKESTVELPKCFDINKYLINLELGQQFYPPV